MCVWSLLQDQNVTNQHNTTPTISKVDTAQNRYGLPSPGSCGAKPCEQWILRVTDEATLPEANKQQQQQLSGGGGGGGAFDARPEVRN